MIFKNDIVVIEGKPFRLLEANAERDLAWVIDVCDTTAFPVRLPWSEISGLEPEKAYAQDLPSSHLSEASRRVRDRAMATLNRILDRVHDLYDESKRHSLLKQLAVEAHVSMPTLYKWLRMYWQNGQCESALLPGYHRSGRTQKLITSGRGAPRKDGVKIYQLTDEDIEKLSRALHEHYFKDERALLKDTYAYLIRVFYSFLDGEGKLYVREPGQRPTKRQLQHYLTTHFPVEVRLRKRKGDNEFERNHRAILGTVSQDCLGVGDIYECDATIADVFLVASDDVQSIVGKATLYFIVDRESRLIVGFYVGLENPSWVCAKQALLFISQDKRAFCEHYGIPFDPEDWPAHQVFPAKVLADLGEWNTKEGEQFGNRMTTNVLYVTGKRPDWKPVVESDFNQVRCTLQDGTPGMDPPENAKKRQGKHYEKEACLNLHQFTKEILALVIKQNRTPVTSYSHTMEELRNGFVPTPIALWNKGVVTRSGVLTRYSEEHVRQQLLPSGEASVTEHGIEFKGCFYTCDIAVARGWFVQARVKRYGIEARFEHRLVNHIYVVEPGSGKLHLCQLSPRSEIHRGRSFSEVDLYTKLRKNLNPYLEQARLQAVVDFHREMDPTFEEAKKALASSPNKRSRSARKADTKEARARDLSIERQTTGSLVSTSGNDANTTSALVVDINAAIDRKKRSAGKSASPNEEKVPSEDGALSMAERARLARERLKESQ